MDCHDGCLRVLPARRDFLKVDKKVFAEQVCVACRLVDKCKETYEPKIDAAVKALGAAQTKSEGAPKSG